MPSASANDRPAAHASMSFTSSSRARNAASDTPWTPRFDLAAYRAASCPASSAAAFGAPSRCLKRTSSAGDLGLPVRHEALVGGGALLVRERLELRVEAAERGQVSLSVAEAGARGERADAVLAEHALLSVEFLG